MKERRCFSDLLTSKIDRGSEWLCGIRFRAMLHTLRINIGSTLSGRDKNINGFNNVARSW
jgi:hypothetical protein